MMKAEFKKIFFSRRGALLLIVLLLATAMLASCAVGNGGEQPLPDGADGMGGTDATTEAVYELTLFSGGATEYQVVRPEEAENTEIYRSFYSRLAVAVGCRPVITTDLFYRGHEYEAEKPEILCGPVDYPEARSGASGLGFYEYRVSVVGNKLVISGRTEEGISAALSAFAEYAEENTEEGVLTIQSTLVLSGEVETDEFTLLTDTVPAPGGFEQAKLSYCGDGFEQATLSSVTADTYTEYGGALADAGFVLFDSNDMNGNLFSTYTKDSVTVRAYYTPHSSEMRVVASDGAPLHSTEEVKYEKTAEPTFTVLGLEKGGSGDGLGCIVGLPDGSFIVIDGGYENTECASDLASTMIRLSGKRNGIVIRAWIFTHGHGDHIGAFRKFSDLYGGRGIFTVESFIYNFCDTPEQRKYGGINYSGVLTRINKYWSDAVCYKGMTGDVYPFAGCEVEVLYCMSDFIPQVLGEEKGISDIDKSNIDGNIETMVFRVNIAGQGLLITGDTSKVCVDEMCKRYGEYLRSDIMTVPHHGHNRNSYRARNGTVEFYQLVRPTVAVWPQAVSAHDARLLWNGNPGGNYQANYLLKNSLGVKEHIVSGATTRTLTLPYEP